MKTFRQFMTEAELLSNIDKDDKLGGMGGSTAIHHGDDNSGDHTTFDTHLDRFANDTRKFHTTRLGKLKGMDVLHIHKPSNPSGSTTGPKRTEDHYVLHDPKTKMVHLHVKGVKHNGVMKISTLSGSGKSPVKAHDFYHHLLKNHVKAMVGTSQSEGGQKVWNRLATKNTVSVHGWDPEKKKPVNIDGRDPDQTHASSDEVRRHDADHDDGKHQWQGEPEPRERANMSLVASYHPLKKLRAVRKG